MISTPPYLRTYPDHPAENVALANQLRTALQGLPEVTRAPIPSTLREPVYDFDVASIYGPMVMSVRPLLLDAGVMFACQFQDPQRAAKHLGSTWGLHRLNPLSGKWNHAFYTYGTEWILRTFLGHLLPILPLPMDETIHASASPYQAQIVMEWRGIQWRAAMGMIAEPTWMASLARLEPWTPERGTQKDNPIRFTRTGQDRAKLAHNLTMSLLCDVQIVLLRNALQSLTTGLESGEPS